MKRMKPFENRLNSDLAQKIFKLNNRRNAKVSTVI